MTKSAADIELEVEASRDNLDRTVEALKDKMTPGQLFDEASRAVGSTGQQVFAKFVEQAKENPMPLAVMGLGLAWLMSSSGRSGGTTSGYREPSSWAPRESNSGGGVRALGEKASGLMSGVKDKLASATSALGESGGAVAHSLSSARTSAADKAVVYRDRARDGVSRMLETEPLLLGAIGLVVGAAIGSALPHTDIEDRTVGPLRDKVLGKGKAVVEETMQQAAGVAQAAYQGAKDEFGSASGGDLAERAENVARSAVQAAREHGETERPGGFGQMQDSRPI